MCLCAVCVCAHIHAHIQRFLGAPPPLPAGAAGHVPAADVKLKQIRNKNGTIVRWKRKEIDDTCIGGFYRLQNEGGGGVEKGGNLEGKNIPTCPLVTCASVTPI